MSASTGLRIKGLHSALAGPFELALAAGEAVCVSGPSGAGKSLFLRMIADLDPNEGEVTLDGVARQTLSGPDWRKRALYLAAETGWWADQVSAHFLRSEADEARALAQSLGLKPELFDGPVGRLSTGEKQRFGLIRGLVRHPPVLLADEPTGALDPEATEQVEAVLRLRLSQGMILILVTHDAAQGARLGARPYRIENGKPVTP